MSQFTRGKARRVMYVENKDGDIDGVPGRIGWVTFSKTGNTVYYRGRELRRMKRGIRGNFYDVGTVEEYWVSGVKRDRSDAHWAESVAVEVDEDASEEYERLLRGEPPT